VKNPWAKALEHGFIAVILAWSLTWAPSKIAGSNIVSKGVENALTWLQPAAEKSAPQSDTVLDKIKSYADRAGNVVQSSAYSVTRSSTTALARFMVWALVFVGLVFWTLFEFRKALVKILEGLLLLPSHLITKSGGGREPKRLM